MLAVFWTVYVVGVGVQFELLHPTGLRTIMWQTKAECEREIDDLLGSDILLVSEGQHLECRLKIIR